MALPAARTDLLPGWYPPGSWVSRIAVVLLVASPLLHVTEAVIAAMRGTPLDELTFISPAAWHIEGIFGLVDAASCIFFCTWWYRAHRNLRTLEIKDLTYTPARAVWAFFIPLIHLVRPEHVAEELWRASCVSMSARNRIPPRDGSSLVSSWWTCFVLAGLTRGCVIDEDGGKTSRPFIIVSYVLLAFASSYAISFIHDIDYLQGKQYEELTAQGNWQSQSDEQKQSER